MPAGNNSQCKSCQGEKQNIFNAEMALHFPGLAGLDKPIVWMFPKVAVCLNCGASEFVVPGRELKVLTTGEPVEGALISISQKAGN
jgi:hypothetical protein